MFKNKFIENFFSLTVLRVLTLIVPLVTYPYLIRVLGSESYGAVMWTWSIVNFFILFINFGFNLSVTKYISIHREDSKEVSKIVSTIIMTKFLLFIISTMLFTLLVFSIPKMAENSELFFLTFLLTIGETMMPIWYFQGIEQMKYTAIITSFVKLFFTVLVFVVIENPDDYLKIPLLYAFASFLSALFAYYIIFYKHNVQIIRPKLVDITFYIKDSVALFLSSSISVIKDSLTIIFIENYIGLSAVAFFDIAQKFVNILLTPFHIVATVLFPHMSKTKNFELLKKTMLYTTLVAIGFYLLTYAFDDSIVSLLYGKRNEVVESILYILSFSIIFANLASLLGTNGLVVVSRNKKLFLSSFYGFLFFIGVLLFLSSFQKLEIVYIAYSIVVTYMVDMLVRIWYMRDILWQK
jgi:PST family polysaccharide transporter